MWCRPKNGVANHRVFSGIFGLNLQKAVTEAPTKTPTDDLQLALGFSMAA
jgi:hypothetical protein